MQFFKLIIQGDVNFLQGPPRLTLGVGLQGPKYFDPTTCADTFNHDYMATRDLLVVTYSLVNLYSVVCHSCHFYDFIVSYCGIVPAVPRNWGHSTKLGHPNSFLAIFPQLKIRVGTYGSLLNDMFRPANLTVT